MLADVILNDGEADVKDRTGVCGATEVDWLQYAACSVAILSTASQGSATYGPSEGFRPPQDDIFFGI